ncbi:MAG: hypothetical protein ACOZE5_14475 [Verrucomicrobiota bacterium]
MSNQFDALLAAYAKQPLPDSDLSSAEIWREIDRRRTQSVWIRMFSIMELRELFAEPRLAVAALAFAAIVGVVPAVLVGQTESERHLARQSIHLDVFAPDSKALGSVFARPVAMVSSFK